MRFALTAAKAVCIALFMTGAAAAQDLKLTTLEWPPYVKADGSGTSTDAVIAAFAKAGAKVEIKVFPWSRAVNLAKSDPAWIGVYPEYYAEAEDVEKGGSRCYYSKSFGNSPLGFAQKADKPIAWSSHDDLKPYTIGVVEGYRNEDKFDAMVASGDIKVDAAPSDAVNIRKVAGGRIDGAVIDREVMEYLLENDPDLAGLKGKVTFNDHLLIEHGLFICFENSEAGKKVRDMFDAAQ